MPVSSVLWHYNEYNVTIFTITIIFLQLFYSFFKSLVGKEIIVELKNDLRLDIFLQ